MAATATAARITRTADRPIMRATASPMTTSGQGEPVSPTANAATSTPALPITSFPEQIHADRMLMSSPRWRQRGAGRPGHSPPDGVEAEAVHDGIAEHVDRIGQEGGGVGGKASYGLGQEHGDVDPQNSVEDSPLPLGDLPDFAALVHELRRHRSCDSLSRLQT